MISYNKCHHVALRGSSINWPTILLYAPTRALRSSTSKFLQVPHTNLLFGSRSFCVSAPTLWNSLPRSVRFCESLTTFRKHLKTFYFQSAFPGAPIATHYPAPPIQFLTLALYKFIYLLTYLLSIQGGPKKVSQIIFAITLSTASQFP